MKGLEISRAYFEEYGSPMLKNGFGDLLKYIAVGYTGSGSEHYGFDDSVSRDHDFEPGFCIFLPSEDIVDRRSAFLLEKAYLKLPKEFMGTERQKLAPVGGNRNGVFRISEFYEKAIGSSDGTLSYDGWLRIPDYALSEATNGEIFFDNFGEITKVRNYLSDMPFDVKLKRLAGNLLLMGQSGQYNYLRCISHGEPEGAQLAAGEFVTSALKCIFLLHNRYMPYYKWSFRALVAWLGENELKEKLSFILNCDSRIKDVSDKKAEVIEEVSRYIISKLKEKGLSDSDSPDLEKHAYAVNAKIKNPEIRNLHILSAI